MTSPLRDTEIICCIQEARNEIAHRGAQLLRLHKSWEYVTDSSGVVREKCREEQGRLPTLDRSLRQRAPYGPMRL